MAFGDIVHQQHTGGTAVFSFTPTAGNALLVVASHRNGMSTVAAPAGWTKFVELGTPLGSGFSDGIALFGKDSNGTETGGVFSGTGGGYCEIFEVEGASIVGASVASNEAVGPPESNYAGVTTAIDCGTVTGGFILGAAATNGDDVCFKTPGAGYTERADFQNSGFHPQTAVITKLSAGGPETPTMTESVLRSWWAVSIGLSDGSPPGGAAGIQTLILEGDTTPDVVVQSRTLYPTGDALLELTPGGRRRGAGGGEYLPCGAYNGYTYRSCIQFPAIDWTGVKRVLAASIVLRRSDQEFVHFGSSPTFIVRRITKAWSPGTHVWPSTANAVRYAGGPTAQSSQVRINADPIQNKNRWVSITGIVREWAPVTAGGKGLKNYGLMLVPSSGRERDTIEFFSVDHGSATRPFLRLVLEVLA